MMSTGTANVGIKLIGRTVITAVLTSLGLMNLAVVPSTTAATRSKIPRICQKIKPLQWLKFASLSAASGAVIPMAISPQPAGRAKTPGRRPAAYSARKVKPAILQECTNVKVRGFNDNANVRNPAEVPNQSRNPTSGKSPAGPSASGGTSGSVLNRCKAEADSAKINHAAIRPP